MGLGVAGLGGARLEIDIAVYLSTARNPNTERERESERDR